jgi:hypothetical protein
VLGITVGFAATCAWGAFGTGSPFLPGLWAQEEQTANAHQLMFVPPPVEGVVSLGVFDARGKLVRVLAQAASVDSFKAGLNGLVADWDGTDAEGKPVPGGKYYARGVVVGDEVDISGEAFYFNDFADNTELPRPSKVMDAALYAKEEAAVLVTADKPEVLIADAKTAEPQHVPLDLPGRLRLKAAGLDLLLLGQDRAEVFDPKTQTVVWRENGEGLRDGDSDGVRTLLLWDQALVLLNGQNRQRLELPARDLAYAAVLQSTVILGTEAGKLWRVDGQRAVPLETNDPKPLLDLAAGREDTAWLLVKEGDQALVRQLDVRSREIRDLELPPDLHGAARISAARDRDVLLLLVKTGDEERVVGLRYQEARAQQSIWEKWFDRARQNFSGFGLKNGQVIPANDQGESMPVLIKPADNPLENARQQVFQLAVSADNSGTWLVNGDGLPICQVSKTKGVKQVRWISDGKNGMRVFVSDGRVVEEYHVTGLENLYRFDAGSFD